VAIDIRQVVNGTTIHVSEMARQLGGGGVSVTGQGKYGGSRFMRLCVGVLCWVICSSRIGAVAVSTRFSRVYSGNQMKFVRCRA
jgi:hypothetical protein